MYDDRKELVQTVGILRVVDGIEEAQLERERDAVRKLDVLADVLLILEPLEVQREDVRQTLDLHPRTTPRQHPLYFDTHTPRDTEIESDAPLLRLLQITTTITKKLVPLTQHLTRTELPQTRRHTGILLNINRQVEERLISR